MRAPIDLASPGYTPGRLLDEAAFVLRAPNRAALALALEVDPALVSRVGRRKSPLTEHVMVQIMDRTAWSIQYVRELAGMPYEGDVYPARPRTISIPLRGTVALPS
jgi:hypothetical protein